MHVPKWLATPFHIKADNKSYLYDLEDELIKCMWTSKPKRCSKVKPSPNIEAMPMLILLISTPCSEQNPSHSYLRSQLHKWLRLVLVM